MPYKDVSLQKKAQHESYLRNKEKVRKASIEKRKRDKEWLDSLKTDPCKDCGVSYPAFVMDFHHLDKSSKLFCIGLALSKVGRERILEEIKKCVLLCANCHRIREHGTTG